MSDKPEYPLDDQLKIKILERTLSILDGGKAWVKDRYFALENKELFNNSEGVKLEDADQFCLAGAVNRAAWELNYPIFLDGGEADRIVRRISLEDVVRERGYKSVPAFNDDSDTTFDEVKDVIEERLAQLRYS